MKFRELKGVEDGVKIRRSDWCKTWFIYYRHGIFYDVFDEVYKLNSSEIIEQEWEYCKELEPEVFCPVCGEEVEATIDSKIWNRWDISCHRGCLGTGYFSTKDKVLEIWKKIGGVR